MALHFLVDEASTVQPGGTVVLTGAEAHHAATVRRVRPRRRAQARADAFSPAQTGAISRR